MSNTRTQAYPLNKYLAYPENGGMPLICTGLAYPPNHYLAYPLNNGVPNTHPLAYPLNDSLAYPLNIVVPYIPNTHCLPLCLPFPSLLKTPTKKSLYAKDHPLKRAEKETGEPCQ